MGGAGVPCQTRQIQQLPIPSGAQPHEGAEDLQVSDIQGQPDVAPDIQLEVVGEPAGRVEAFGMDSGIETPEEGFHEVGLGTPARRGNGAETVRVERLLATEFREGEREQAKHRGAAGEGLARALHPQEIL